jgi:hypothetical protein
MPGLALATVGNDLFSAAIVWTPRTVTTDTLQQPSLL